MTTCTTPDCDNPVENRDTGLCASCGQAKRKQERQAKAAHDKRQRMIEQARVRKPKAPIRKISDKHRKELDAYMPERDKFLNGKRCAVYPEKKATEVHHMRGKGTGYFDAWAAERGITKLMDQRFWLSVSRDGHRRITDNSAWALENGYSLPR